ncbi:MAG: hypothetical protein AB7G47_06480 [Mycolicibacterium sp.]|uniref:hypothetical protein n=1 Tax=Mycolicibacterium sp. TaxID=2320850 RepID=UPI003D0BD115
MNWSVPQPSADDDLAVDVVDQPKGDGGIRRRSLVALATTVAVVIGAAIVALVLTGRADRPGDIASLERAVFADWWTAAEPYVSDLQDAIDDSQRALRTRDGPVLAASCQRMHDAAAVDIPAHLPTPDPHLSAELQAASDDAHTAAHMCLSALGHSPNNYDIEFLSNLDQAVRHLRAAVSIVDRNLTGQPRSGA